MELTILKRPDDDDKIELLEQTLEQLRESNAALFEKVIATITIGMAKALLSETQDIEREGGEMVAGGARRKTPGGVYLGLLKKRIPPETAKLIWEEQNRAAREQKKRLASRTPLDKEIDKMSRSARQKRPRCEQETVKGEGEERRQFKRSKSDSALREHLNRQNTHSHKRESRDATEKSHKAPAYVDRDSSRSAVKAAKEQLPPLCNYSDIL